MRRVILFFFLGIGLILLIFLITKQINNDILMPNFNYRMDSFHGIISTIKHDSKHVPNITIDEKVHHLGNSSFELENVLKKNDSIVKYSGENDYYLYRKDNYGVWQLIYGKQ